MRAFVYCRVSTEEQGREDHYSLDFQEEMARNRIKERGWRLVKLRKDIASGKGIEGRPGFQELSQSIEAGAVDVVVVYRLDRLSRNVRDVYEFLELAQAHQVEFVSLTEGFDTTTPMGRAMLGIAAVFAQLTRETIAENVKNGLVQRAKTGQWCGGSKAPPGYDYSPDTGLSVNHEEARLVRRIFDLYTENKLGINRLARYLNEQGTLSPTGAQWTASLITRLLQNPVYRTPAL